MVLRSAIALLIYFSAIHSASSEGIRLRYAQAYSALRTIFALPLFVAEREGFFVREGLDFSMVPVSGGGEQLVAALHNGSPTLRMSRPRSSFSRRWPDPTRLPSSPSSTIRFTA